MCVEVRSIAVDFIKQDRVGGGVGFDHVETSTTGLHLSRLTGIDVDQLAKRLEPTRLQMKIDEDSRSSPRLDDFSIAPRDVVEMIKHRPFGTVRISFGHRSENRLMGLISDLILAHGQCRPTLLQ